MRRNAKCAAKLAAENRGLIYRFTQLRQAWAEGFGIDEDEVFGIATEAYVRAAGCFDPSRGFRFSTYAFSAMQKQLSREIQKRSRRGAAPVSLDAPLKTSGKPRHELVPCPKSGADRERFEALDAIAVILPKLTQTQQEVLRGRFWEELTLEQVGLRIGVTKERVRQIQNQALAKIRRMSA